MIYEIYSGEKCLYVGLGLFTNRPLEHKSKEWFEESTHINITHTKSKLEDEILEVRKIKELNPVYNKHYKTNLSKLKAEKVYTIIEKQEYSNFWMMIFLGVKAKHLLNNLKEVKDCLTKLNGIDLSGLEIPTSTSNNNKGLALTIRSISDLSHSYYGIKLSDLTGLYYVK